MTALATPDIRLHRSWAAAMAELHPEGEHVDGSGLWLLPESDQWDLTEAGCARLVAELVQRADPAFAPDGLSVPCHFLWITDPQDSDPDGTEEVVGFLALRTQLNDWLLEEGGHIGYSVVPSRRRQGHASRALRLAVRRAGDLGIDRVLVTCDEDNVASARTIERGGGVHEDTRNGKRRYWIDAR